MLAYVTPHYLSHSKLSIPSVVKHIIAVIKSVCPPLKGVNAGGDFFYYIYVSLLSAQ